MAGLQLPVFGIDCKEGRTNPPAAFTEGTLIHAMENIHQAVDDPQNKKFLKPVSEDVNYVTIGRANLKKTVRTDKIFETQISSS